MAFYYVKPKPGVQTQIAGWMNDTNNIRYDERVEITRGLKKDAVSAKIIMNLSDKTVERNGWNDNKNFDELFKYFFKGYHQYITKVMTQLDPEYFSKMLDEMQSELDAEKSAEEAATAE